MRGGGGGNVLENRKGLRSFLAAFNLLGKGQSEETGRAGVSSPRVGWLICKNWSIACCESRSRAWNLGR